MLLWTLRGMHIYFQISVFIFFRWSNHEWNCWMIRRLYHWLFWGIFVLYSTVIAPVYIPTNSTQSFPFLHFFTNSYVLSFDCSHSDRCAMFSHCGFDVHFLVIVMFSYAYLSSLCLFHTSVLMFSVFSSDLFHSNFLFDYWYI